MVGEEPIRVWWAGQRAGRVYTRGAQGGGGVGLNCLLGTKILEHFVEIFLGFGGGKTGC